MHAANSPFPAQAAFLNQGNGGDVGPQCIYYDGDQLSLGPASSASACNPALHSRFTVVDLGQSVGLRFEETDSPGHCLLVQYGGIGPLPAIGSCDGAESIWSGGGAAGGPYGFLNSAHPPQSWYLIAAINTLGVAAGMPGPDDPTVWQFQWNLV